MAEGPGPRPALGDPGGNELGVGPVTKGSRAIVNDPPERSVDDGSMMAALRVTLAKQLESLPRRQRDVVELRYLADLTEVQVAALLGVSQGSVKRHAQRGLSALRALQIEGVA